MEDEFPFGPFQEMFGILQESVQTSVDSRKSLNILETPVTYDMIQSVI